jgi:GMP synthase (glutamine-hydrolysing)
MEEVRILVVEANIKEARANIARYTGATPSESYAAVIRSINADLHVDITFPADANAEIDAPLESYDGVVFTGSALNIHKREHASLRQIDFARSAFESGVPMFGSCWGLQLAAVAAGGDVAPNRRGCEAPFARGVALTRMGSAHPMHTGKPQTFDAPAIHSDEVVRLPSTATVTATNGMCRIQAAEIRYRNSAFWGVQYHPEYSFATLAGIVRTFAVSLVREGTFPSHKVLGAVVADIEALGMNGGRSDIAKRLNVGSGVTDVNNRVREIANWLGDVVIKAKSDKFRAGKAGR